jgi:hypothetical protein
MLAAAAAAASVKKGFAAGVKGLLDLFRTRSASRRQGKGGLSRS